MAGHETLYTWKTLEELGVGCVFLLAANAVNLALSFMGRWVTTQGGEGERGCEFEEEEARWAGAQERILFTAQQSGKLQAGLVYRGMEMTRPSRSWEDLARYDAQARANLKAVIARASPNLNA